MVDNISAIYSIKNLITNKCYVGSALKIYSRWREHRVRLKANTHHNKLLQRAYNKYGKEAFEFKILEIVNDKTKLLEREQWWIDTLGCVSPNGYNLRPTAHNQLGIKHSEETKLKMSIASKGRKISDEQKIKISNSLKGKKFPSTRKTIKGKPWSETRRLAQTKVTYK